MTALVIAADQWTAERAAADLELDQWTTPDDLVPTPVVLIVWVKGWRWSIDAVRDVEDFLTLSPHAMHVQHRSTDADEMASAIRAARRLDHDRAVRAVQRTLATLPPTISPESLAAASTITPERTSWWRRLFRKAAR